MAHSNDTTYQPQRFSKKPRFRATSYGLISAYLLQISGMYYVPAVSARSLRPQYRSLHQPPHAATLIDSIVVSRASQHTCIAHHTAEHYQRIASQRASSRSAVRSSPRTLLLARRYLHVAPCTSLFARCSSHVAISTSLFARRSSHVASRTSLFARRSSHVALSTSLFARCYLHVAPRTLLLARCFSHVAICASLLARRS